MNNNNGTISFEIKKHVGVIKDYPTGWLKEVNIVSWNGSTPKYDIRDWDPDHERMSRGITLSPEEMGKLVEAVKTREPEVNRFLEN